MKPYDYYEIKTPWYGNEPHEPVAKKPSDSELCELFL